MWPLPCRCPSDMCKIATCSDDYTVRLPSLLSFSRRTKPAIIFVCIVFQVRLWRAREASFQSQQHPSCSMRRRVSANPSTHLEAKSPGPRRLPDFGCMDLEPSLPVDEHSDWKENAASVEEMAGGQSSPGNPLACLDANMSDFTRRRAESALATEVEASCSQSSAYSNQQKRQRTIVDYFR